MSEPENTLSALPATCIERIVFTGSDQEVSDRVLALERLQSRFYKREFLPMAADLTGIKATLAAQDRLLASQQVMLIETREITTAFQKDVNYALFDAENGLVHLRTWMCRIATTVAKIAAWFGALIVGGIAVASQLHQFGFF